MVQCVLNGPINCGLEMEHPRSTTFMWHNNVIYRSYRRSCSINSVEWHRSIELGGIGRQPDIRSCAVVPSMIWPGADFIGVGLGLLGSIASCIIHLGLGILRKSNGINALLHICKRYPCHYILGWIYTLWVTIWHPTDYIVRISELSESESASASLVFVKGAGCDAHTLSSHMAIQKCTIPPTWRISHKLNRLGRSTTARLEPARRPEANLHTYFMLLCST